MNTSLSKLLHLAMLVGLSAFLLPISAEARLGESKDELLERYKKPLRDVDPQLEGSDEAMLFFKDHVEVHVEFKNGKAWYVIYRTSKMNSDLEAKLREANAGESEWQDPVEHLQRKYWKSKDEERFAVLYAVGSIKQFRFVTEDALQALEDKRVAAIEKAVSGDIEEDPAEEEEKEEEVEEEEATEEEEESPF